MNNMMMANRTTAATLTNSAELSAGIYAEWVRYIDAKPRTVETYSKNVRLFLAYLKDNSIKQPTREDVLRYRENLGKTHKPTTVTGYLAAVKLFFQWTEQAGLYPNIAAHIKGAKLDEGFKKDYLTSKQAGKLLNGINTDGIKGKRDFAIIALMLTTGLRTVSIINANIEDVRVAGDDTVLYYQGKGHTEKAEYVKLAEPVEDAIRAYLQERKDADGRAPLFASNAHRNGGERMTTRSISRICKSSLVSVGLESDRLTAHSLRHTAATLNLLNGASVEETQQLLGHKSINTTMIYAHALERSRNQSEKRIARAIFG